MEDFPILLVFLLFYLIAGASGSKKKKRQSAGRARRGPMRTAAEGEQMDMKSLQRSRQTQAGFEQAFEQTKIHMDHGCEGERIHLHEVTQEDMLHAAEGEDPCHGGDSAQKERFELAGEEDELQYALRQDVLRGIVMREILNRPHERRAWQRSRRDYHG